MVHPMQSFDEAAQLVYDPPNGQDGGRHSKLLELRDALEMGRIGIVKELSQLFSKGALRMEC